MKPNTIYKIYATAINYVGTYSDIVYLGEYQVYVDEGNDNNEEE